MALDLPLVLTGALVGGLVGLTGMGGGALLTPILVLVFGVPPLAAVSSDLVTSLVMKPFGAAVHWRHRTVDVRLLGWLALGSVPAAFLGSVVIGTLGHGGHADEVSASLKILIAVALLGSIAATVWRTWRTLPAADDAPPAVRPARTVLIGVIGGLAVGLTSVGAGSLVIAMLLIAYPTLTPRRLVGTDIVQAIPLVAAAALGHLLFGDVHFGLTASLVLGAVPAVLLGARLSAVARTGIVRPIITAVLGASALALLGVPTVGIVGGGLAAAGLVMASQNRAGSRQAEPVGS